MNCIFRLLCAFVLVAVADSGLCTETLNLDEIRPERIGEFVTVAGKVADFFPPPEPRAPFAFSLKDENGKEMRVVAWPDIFERVDHKELLKQKGTSVTLTAEVAEYKEKLELHLQDWEEINVAPEPMQPDAGTTAATRETTAPLSQNSKDGLTTGSDIHSSVSLNGNF